MFQMNSLPKAYRAIVIGSTGGLGSAFVELLSADANCSEVVGFSRNSMPGLDLSDEAGIAAAAKQLAASFHLIIDATGFLSDGDTLPEKSLRAVETDNLLRLYQLNAIGPVLLMKHFSKLMPKSERSIFATLSARVGSTGDNRLGGWYAYRASKAALNMLMKCAAIETARTKPNSVFASLHPGTVATGLSEPFASGVERLNPQQSATQLLKVLDGLEPEESGSFWDYQGKRVEW